MNISLGRESCKDVFALQQNSHGHPDMKVVWIGQGHCQSLQDSVFISLGLLLGFYKDKDRIKIIFSADGVQGLTEIGQQLLDLRQKWLELDTFSSKVEIFLAEGTEITSGRASHGLALLIGLLHGLVRPHSVVLEGAIVFRVEKYLLCVHFVVIKVGVRG